MEKIAVNAVGLPDSFLPYFQSKELALPSPGKYDKDYCDRYTALWSYGSTTVGEQGMEPLYALVQKYVRHYAAEATQDRLQFFVDMGCGVGRVTSDMAKQAPQTLVLGIDASPSMIQIANALHRDGVMQTFSLRKYGYQELSVSGEALPNIGFIVGDCTACGLESGTVDLITHINVIDRVAAGPRAAFDECYRVLKTGGALVLTDPLCWETEAGWDLCPDLASVLALMRDCGFEIVASEEFKHSELLDKRGTAVSHNAIGVLAIKA